MPETAPCVTAAVRLAIAIAIAALAASLVFAPRAAAVPPTGADFSVTWPGSPSLTRPLPGEVTFTGSVTSWGGADGTFSWSFGDGATGTGQTVTHDYSAPGSYLVVMTPINGEAIPEPGAPATQTVVVNAPPTAAFSFAPTSPFPGQDVKFASESDDPDGGIASYDWGFGDGVGSSARSPIHPFATPGVTTVTLTVTDAYGAQSTTSQTLVVQALPIGANAPPIASFAYSPSKPRVGQQVEFVSSAVDPEGNLREQRWDLDGDGQFDDARGDDVVYTFASSGVKPVRLRVEDAAGGAAVRERSITVAAAPKPRAGFLSPSPVVRITGEVRPYGALVHLLSVRAPRGSLVRVRCRGKKCPVKVRRHRVTKKHRVVRFRAFERRLRAGIKLDVFIRKSGTIGKFTRFKIRRNLSPKRVDRCLMPGRAKPIRCPS